MHVELEPRGHEVDECDAQRSRGDPIVLSIACRDPAGAAPATCPPPGAAVRRSRRPPLLPTPPPTAPPHPRDGNSVGRRTPGAELTEGPRWPSPIHEFTMIEFRKIYPGIARNQTGRPSPRVRYLPAGTNPPPAPLWREDGLHELPQQHSTALDTLIHESNPRHGGGDGAQRRRRCAVPPRDGLDTGSGYNGLHRDASAADPKDRVAFTTPGRARTMCLDPARRPFTWHGSTCAVQAVLSYSGTYVNQHRPQSDHQRGACYTTRLHSVQPRQADSWLCTSRATTGMRSEEPWHNGALHERMRRPQAKATSTSTCTRRTRATLIAAVIAATLPSGR